MYQLYISYIMIFIFGFNDGMYLKYGNYSIDQLNKTNIKSSINTMGIVSLTVTIILFLILIFNFSSLNPDKYIVFFCVLSNLLVMNYYGTFLTILQFTNEIIKYTKIILLTKVIFTSFLIFFISIGYINYQVVIFGEFSSKLIVLFYLWLYVFKKIDPISSKFKFEVTEYKELVKIGYKILLSNIIGLLIIGLGRIYIERTMEINLFANYSFGITIVSFVLLFVTASSIPIYPLLTRYNIKSHFEGFNLIKWSTIFIFCAFSISIVFLDNLIETFLPSYSNVINYFPFLYLIVYFESKSLITYLNYFKIVRKELNILYINLASISFVFIGLLLINCLNFNDSTKILLVLFVTTFSLYLKATSSEIYLSKILGKKSNISFVVFESILLTYMVCIYLYELDYVFIFSLFVIIFISAVKIKNSVSNLN